MSGEERHLTPAEQKTMSAAMRRSLRMLPDGREAAFRAGLEAAVAAANSEGAHLSVIEAIRAVPTPAEFAVAAHDER